MLKVKHILSTASILAMLTGTAHAEKMIAATITSPTHFLSAEGMIPLMECIKERTSGAVDFDFYPSGQLADTAGTFDAVMGGLAHLGLLATSSMSDKFQLNQITMLPGMGDNVGDIVAAYRKMMAENGVMAQELKTLNVMPLTVIFLPPYQIGLKGSKIEKIEDFTGKKVRVSGGAQVVGLEALGGVPVQIQSADAYVAMQQGTVDGYLLSIASVTAYKLEEQTTTFSTNGNFANALTFLAMDQRVFDKLPPEQQKAMSDCGLEVEAHMVEFLDGYAKQLETDFAKAGIDVYQFSPELWADIVKVMAPVTDDYIKRMTELGLPGQQALDEYRKALGQ